MRPRIPDKQYAVAVGKRALGRPGTYVIGDKVPAPTWWSPAGREIPYRHADNPLGARWLGLSATGDTADVRGLGIHGGGDGKHGTAACISMRDDDVTELFDLVPAGTPVLLATE